MTICSSHCGWKGRITKMFVADYRGLAQSAGFIIAISILCYAFQATNLTLFGDDWSMIHSTYLAGRFGIGTGRWLATLLWHVFAENAFMPIVTISFGCLLLGCSALVVSNVFQLDSLSRVFFILLYMSNPFLIEPFTFNIGHVPGALSMLLVALSAHFLIQAFQAEEHKETIINGLLSALTLTLTAAINQTSALMMIIILNFYVLINHARFTGQLLVRFCVVCLSVAAISITLYVISVLLSWEFSGFGPLQVGQYDITQGYSVGVGSILSRLQELVVIWRDYLKGSVHGHFKVTKWLLISLFIAGLVFFAAKAVRLKQMSGLVIPVIFLVCLVAPFLLYVLREQYYPRYNTLLPLGVMLALLPVILLNSIASPALRVMVSAICAIIVVGNIFAHNIVAVGKVLIFNRDMALAGRVLNRIEMKLDASETGKYVNVRLIGFLPLNERARPFGDGAGPDPGQKYFVSSIAECSVFACQTNRFFFAIQLLEAGLKIVRNRGPMTPDQQAFVASMPVWPHKDAVAKFGDVWMVKLSDPK